MGPIQSHLLLPPLRRFYVPSRVDLAAMISEDVEEDDSDDVAMILEKLRRSDEVQDQHEEARLLTWMQLQQEVRAGEGPRRWVVGEGALRSGRGGLLGRGWMRVVRPGSHPR